MGTERYYVTIDDGWENGVYEKRTRWTPLGQNEARLMEKTLQMKAVADAQQLLLEHYAQQGIEIVLPQPPKFGSSAAR